MPDPRIDTLDGFLELEPRLSNEDRPSYQDIFGRIHCSECQRDMKARVHTTFSSNTNNNENLSVFVGSSSCVNCGKYYRIFYDRGFSTTRFIFYAFNNSTHATPNTPIPVRYYIDQAYASHSVGANSAALAMFRAAVEHILYSAGFEKKCLAQKLNS